MDLRILTFHCYSYGDEQPNSDKSTNIFPKYLSKKEKEINETLYKECFINISQEKKSLLRHEVNFESSVCIWTVEELYPESLLLLATNVHITYHFIVFFF